jgi:hypothetical protein
MSQHAELPTEFVMGETDPDEWIRENYAFCEREANSDGPHAWVFQRFIDSVDDPRESESTDASGGMSA